MNSVPFYLLGLCSISLLFGLMWYGRSVRPLLMTLIFSGMIYVFELFILVVANAYEYRPEVLERLYYDNVFGAIISNFLAVPIVAAFTSQLQLRTHWLVLIGFGFGGIEWLFLRLHVYHHHWWYTGYTIFFIILFLLLTRWWVRMMYRSRLGMYLSLLMFSWSLVSTLVFVLAVTEIRIFHVGLFQDIYRDDIFTSAIYGFLKATVLSWAVFRSNARWYSAVSLVFVFAGNYALIRLDILRISIPMWQYWMIYTPCCITVLWIILLTYRHLCRASAPA
jgi:hypothetical protein